MNNKKICRLISICLAIFSAVLAVVFICMGRKRASFYSYGTSLFIKVRR